MSFHIKPRISTQRAFINKFSLIHFYVPSTIISHPYNPFPHILPRFLLEWISKLFKFFSNLAHLLKDYTFFLLSRTLLCLESGSRFRGNYLWALRAISIILPGICFGESFCLLNHGGLTSSVKGEMGNNSRTGAEGTTSSDEMRFPWESGDSKFSVSLGPPTHAFSKI